MRRISRPGMDNARARVRPRRRSVRADVDPVAAMLTVAVLVGAWSALGYVAGGALAALAGAAIGLVAALALLMLVSRIR